MDRERIAAIRQLVQDATPNPKTCQYSPGVYIESSWERRQADAKLYRQAWKLMCELLDAVDPQPEAVRDGISGFADG